jgi:hypothetical protein
LLYRSIDVPKAEIIFVDDGHFKHFPFAAGGLSRPGSQPGITHDRAVVNTAFQAC